MWPGYYLIPLLGFGFFFAHAVLHSLLPRGQWIVNNVAKMIRRGDDDDDVRHRSGGGGGGGGVNIFLHELALS